MYTLLSFPKVCSDNGMYHDSIVLLIVKPFCCYLTLYSNACGEHCRAWMNNCVGHVLFFWELLLMEPLLKTSYYCEGVRAMCLAEKNCESTNIHMTLVSMKTLFRF